MWSGVIPSPWSRNLVICKTIAPLINPPPTPSRRQSGAKWGWSIINRPPTKVSLITTRSQAEAADGEGSSISGDNNNNNNKKMRGRWKMDKAELAKLGLAAVLAYGLFDGVTYTSFFVLAFLGYESSTGNNPAANLKSLLGIVILMWTGNNVTRPFRVAGAAALAPLIDKGLKRIQKYFNFPSLVHAFALLASLMATLCLMVAGLLVLSRWGK